MGRKGSCYELLNLSKVSDASSVVHLVLLHFHHFGSTMKLLISRQRNKQGYVPLHRYVEDCILYLKFKVPCTVKCKQGYKQKSILLWRNQNGNLLKCLFRFVSRIAQVFPLRLFKSMMPENLLRVLFVHSIAELCLAN